MAVKYIGGGFIPGVPARDLTDAEAKQYGEKALLSSGLYRKVRETKLAVPEYENKTATDAVEE